VRPTPFRVDLGDDVLAAIRARLCSATLPPPRGNGWEHGASVDYLEHFRRHWLDEFDWAAAQERLNAHPQFTAAIDGLEIHFYWVRGSGAAPRPVLLTHGWPGSVIEFLPVIETLAHPETTGGESTGSFDVVVPSLPGFGFSGRPEGVVGPQPTARLWRRLMTDVLGYERFRAQGGDLGSMVTAYLGGLTLCFLPDGARRFGVGRGASGRCGNRGGWRLGCGRGRGGRRVVVGSGRSGRRPGSSASLRPGARRSARDRG
jgi:hypothetical protein